MADPIGPAAAAATVAPVAAPAGTPASVPVSHLSTIVEASVKGVVGAERAAIRGEMSVHPFTTALIALAVGISLGITICMMLHR